MSRNWLLACELLRQPRLRELPQDGSGRQLGAQGSNVLLPTPGVTSYAEATLRRSPTSTWTSQGWLLPVPKPSRKNCNGGAWRSSEHTACIHSASFSFSTESTGRGQGALDHSGKTRVYCGFLPLETETRWGPERANPHWNSVLVSLIDPVKP